MNVRLNECLISTNIYKGNIDWLSDWSFIRVICRTFDVVNLCIALDIIVFD